MVLLALSGLFARSSQAATTLDRTFEFAADRVSLSTEGDVTVVRARGAIPEFREGRPEVPWYSETIELPLGMRIRRTEVISVETEPLALRVQLPSARLVEPGLGPVLRGARDARFFSSTRMQPELPVELGAQGGFRGRDVATLNLAAVRWNPSSGRLERVKRVTVRLELEAAAEPSLVRERVVPEWEGGASSGGREASRLSANSIKAPRRAEPFVASQLPSVLGSPVEYVIITDEVQAPTYQLLADWKTQKGVPAVVRTLSFIQQQYPVGSDDAERIRLFLRDAYTRWGIKYALLAGDTDVLPTRFPYTRFYNGNYIASDLYYSCLDGTWNADGDSIYGEGYTDATDPGDNCDLYPEVYIGRAPTVTVAEAQQFIQKSFQYERTPVGDYEDRVLFFAEVLFPQDWQPGQAVSLDGAELVEDVLPTLDTNPAIHYGRLYQNYLDTLWTPGSLLETRNAVLDSLDVGYNVAVHVGHGYRNVMSVGDNNLTNQDASSLTNGNRLTNLYAINCTSNAIDFPSIGEAFMKAPNGGAVTNIGSTHLDFPTAGRAYQTEYFTLLYEDSVTTIGEAQALQKVPFIGFATYDGVNRWTQMTLLLLGDPEIPVFTGLPRTLTVAHPSSIAASDTTISVHVEIGGQPLYGARVTAYIPGVAFGTLTTDGAGDALVPIRPDSAGSVVLTVTGFDCSPYQVSVPITTPAQPVIALDASSIDDDDLDGTIGNGDGILDAGETVDLQLGFQNRGGAGAPSVSASLTTTDPEISIPIAFAVYGAMGAGSTTYPSTDFRISVPANIEDQRELPFEMSISDGMGQVTRRVFFLTVHAPELRSYTHVVLDPLGNGNGIPDPGETVTLRVNVRNDGTGQAETVQAKLRNLTEGDPNVDIFDSLATVPNLATGVQLQSDDLSLRFNNSSGVALLYLYDQHGLHGVQQLDAAAPSTPTSLVGFGAATDIMLQWAHSPSPDLFGYFVYRSLASGGPFVRVNVLPTARTSYYRDEGLLPLTRYYYKVSAVDSSGNESPTSPAASVSTNPPLHAIFPIPMNRETPASVAVDHVFPGYPMDIVAGSDLIYIWHIDGLAPIDADGGGSTSGDFTNRGSYYAAGPSIGDLDGDHVAEIVGTSWDSSAVYTFDLQGNVRAGWPMPVSDGIWSAAALGDIDNDGKMEIMTGSNGNRFYAARENGQELIDGDFNPSTTGVFKLLGDAFNFGTAAIADLDGNGVRDIVYGSADGWLYAWRADGTNLPGFPRYLGGAITSSVAVGYLDGSGDSQLDIIVTSNVDSVWCVRADGTRRWAKWFRVGGTSKAPSPALADVNNDGFLDAVLASTNGGMYVYDRNGNLVFPWVNIRYSPLTGGASESSPVAADINGDGITDVVMGDETGTLSAFSGNNAQLLAGFPIIVGGEIRGVPALCDCDADGKTEIVLAGWDKNLYVWDYDFTFNPNGSPAWPQFHHDARRTGYFGSPLFVDVEEPVTTNAPSRLELAAPSPNPSSTTTALFFGVPADAAGERFELAAFDLAGRRMKTIASGVAKSGQFVARWDLQDADGNRAPDGVYFVRFALGGRAVSRKFIVIR